MNRRGWRRRPEPPPPDVDRPRWFNTPGGPVAETPAPRRVPISLDQRDIQAAAIRVLVIVSVWLIVAWVVGVVQHFLFLILLAWLAAIASEPAIRWFLRRGMRRSADALAAPTYVEDKDSGELRRPHHIDLKTGMYRGRQVLKSKKQT